MVAYASDEHLAPPPARIPRIDEIPTAPYGLDPVQVAEAFDAMNRELAWYRSRPLDALPVPTAASGADLRQDALRLIKAAVEFADVVERDAQEVVSRQITQLDAEVRHREGALRARETALADDREELERQKAELVLATRRECEGLIAAAHREAAEIRNEAEAARLHILEASRQQAIEVTGAARADVERTFEWSRAQADAIVRRARAVAEQMLTASLRGESASDVVRAIVASAESQVGVIGPPARPELPARSDDQRLAGDPSYSNGGVA